MGASGGRGRWLPFSVVLMVFGALLLVDGLVGFGRYGLGWLTGVDNMVLYAAVIYLFVGSERAVGVVLALVWLFLNLPVFRPMMAGVPFYVLPACLLVVGALILLFVRK